MCNCEIDIIYKRLAATDGVIAKTLSLDEITQLAKIELRLRQYLEAKWNTKKKLAIAKATSMAGAGKNAAQISAAIDSIMEGWTIEVIPTFNKEMKETYRLARIAGWKKATKRTKRSLQYNMPATFGEEKTTKKSKKPSIEPSFDLVDEEAVAALEERNVFWVGRHYDENLSETIATTAKETMIEAGKSPSKASELMSERIKRALTVFVTPSGFAGTEKQYFEGLVANSMTVGRTYGQLRSFAEIGIQKYTIVNPGGSRICPVCSEMNGQTFTLSQGLSQISLEYSSKKPEDIKSIHPWPRTKQAVFGKTSDQLSKSGLSLPAYHFRCRCTVDIVDVESYSDLKPVDFPIPKK
jgi:hypothetical protein